MSRSSRKFVTSGLGALGLLLAAGAPAQAVLVQHTGGGSVSVDLDLTDDVVVGDLVQYWVSYDTANATADAIPQLTQFGSYGFNTTVPNPTPVLSGGAGMYVEVRDAFTNALKRSIETSILSPTYTNVMSVTVADHTTDYIRFNSLTNDVIAPVFFGVSQPITLAASATLAFDDPTATTALSDALPTSAGQFPGSTNLWYAFSGGGNNFMGFEANLATHLANGTANVDHAFINGLVFDPDTGLGYFQVPEPATLALVGAGASALALRRRKDA